VSGCIRARPEHTLRNGTAPSEIVLAGQSAGAGLAVATLVNARNRGLRPLAATLVMSPYADLTLTGAIMETKREVDPLSLNTRPLAYV
jgi:epsilon-lactone hydrolase